MKKMVVGILFLFLLMGCSNTGSGSNNTEGKKLSFDEAFSMMEELDQYTIVDVRTKEEYDSGHIPGAINIPNEFIQAGDFSLMSDKEATYFIYCRSGNRSNQALNVLVDEGYTSVYDIGGIIDYTGPIE